MNFNLLKIKSDIIQQQQQKKRLKVIKNMKCRAGDDLV